MIESITFSCGQTPNSPCLVLEEVPGVTVFVGPNNSGKSVMLDALHKAITTGRQARPSALQGVRIKKFDKSTLESRKDFVEKENQDQIKIGTVTRSKFRWIQALCDDPKWQGSEGGLFRQSQALWMNGTTRLSMLLEETNPSLVNPSTPLARLLVDDEQRRRFQEAVYDGIRHYPIIDHVTEYGKLRLTFSKSRPTPSIERRLERQTLDFVKNTLDRKSVSDGLNAYVGMIGSVFANDYKYILIDEPEAFLHPALARTLGKQLALRAHDRHVFVASHSADFVVGLIESGTPTRIVRLQYHNEKPTACLLDQKELSSFMNDPLLRSVNVLSGLFAGSVVVGESDADRAFYQEINTRLLTAKDPRGVENAVFLNAQNKQTIPKIVGLLRKMGVPCVGITDLDVLSEGGTVWANQTNAVGIPNALKVSLDSARLSVKTALEKARDDKKGYKSTGGIGVLDSGTKDAAEELLNTLRNYGLMVVPRGELEAWLSDLNISRSKTNWLRQIFDVLGADPNLDDYVLPGEGDVWDFIGEINNWLLDSDRKGMKSQNPID